MDEMAKSRDRLSGVVMDSLDGNLTTAEMSRRAYHSRTQFYRLFRALIDETPAVLLLERAAFQLRNTSTSVTEIALDANYNSLEAFTRAFRKAFQMDLFDRFAGNDSWHTRRLLESAKTLTDEQLDRQL